MLGLPVDQTRRIVFHEITKSAIMAAIENPRTIDMNLVNAQQARRVLDRLVGFELSPVLWKKVKPSLSAGRVQSVAVRLIVEREREIMNFRSTPYYRVTARFYRTDDPAKPFSRRNSTGGSIRPKRLKDSSGRAGRPTSGYSAAKANLPNATRPAVHHIHTPAGGGT